jgi:hypothetical protein
MTPPVEVSLAFSKEDELATKHYVRLLLDKAIKQRAVRMEFVLEPKGEGGQSVPAATAPTTCLPDRQAVPVVGGPTSGTLAGTLAGAAPTPLRRQCRIAPCGAQFDTRTRITLAPRGTSGERAGERGPEPAGRAPAVAPPLPAPLLHFMEEREWVRVSNCARLNA